MSDGPFDSMNDDDEILPFAADWHNVVQVMRSRDGTMQADIVRRSNGFTVELFHLTDLFGYPTATRVSNSHTDTLENAILLAREGIGGSEQRSE
jgi:hypothetical protein